MRGSSWAWGRKRAQATLHQETNDKEEGKMKSKSAVAVCLISSEAIFGVAVYGVAVAENPDTRQNQPTADRVG